MRGREDDMSLVNGSAVPLRVPEAAAGPAVLVKNLYLSCDPYVHGRMRDVHGSYIPPFKPEFVSPFSTLTALSSCCWLIPVYCPEKFYCVKGYRRAGHGESGGIHSSGVRRRRHCLGIDWLGGIQPD
uniref:Predicted protein n=1 Tax=Hordeum vulgare subsp. vulgare TaxID=112509 RepID=F2DNX8_HORVV|nr:predicted protein [Hordeum vulgare subsp. vulgare]